MKTISEIAESELKDIHIRSLTVDVSTQADRIECLENDINFLTEQLDAKERIIKALLKKEKMVADYIRSLDTEPEILS